MDCVDGVMITPYQVPDGLQISDGASCNAACAALGSGSCCEGDQACDGFTGTRERYSHIHMILP